MREREGNKIDRGEIQRDRVREKRNYDHQKLKRVPDINRQLPYQPPRPRYCNNNLFLASDL